MTAENTTKEIIEKFLIENDEINRYFHNGNPYRYFDANYPDCILVEVEKGGSRGGNCWNDDPSEPYERDSEAIEKDIIYALKNRMSDLIKDLDIDVESPEARMSFFTNTYNLNNNEVREKYIDEYYGNYTHEVIYAVKIKDLLEPMLSHEDFEILESCLHDFIMEKKPELLEEEDNNRLSRKFK